MKTTHTFLQILTAKYNLTASLSDKIGENIKDNKDGINIKNITNKIKILEDGIRLKEIYNVDYNAAKEALSRAYDRLGRDLHPTNWEALQAGTSAPYALVHYPNFLKKQKNLTISPDMQWWSDLAKLVQCAKLFIKKGRKLDVEKEKRKAEKAYTPPTSAEKDLEMLEDVLKKLLKDWYVQQVRIFEGSLKKGAESLLNFYSQEDWRDLNFPKHLEPYREFILNAPSKYNKEKTTPSLVAPDIFRADAEKYTKQTQAFFLKKQKAKLTSIIGKKGALKTVRADRIGSKHGVLEGTIHFVFDNGDKFLVHNQAVSKVSMLGRWFSQFPTTFHDIELDGKRYKKQSEEWMNKVFCAPA